MEVVEDHVEVGVGVMMEEVVVVLLGVMETLC